jgi:hypothetical protein
MAKINELTDSQLEKAIFKYSEAHKSSPSEKTQNILKQLMLERKSRSHAVKSTEGDDLSQLSKIAEAAVTKKKAEKKKKENRLKIQIKKGPGPVVGAKVGNGMLMGGLVCGALGAIMLLEDYFLHFISPFPGQSVLYFVLIGLGLGLSKAASALTDDNR